MATRWKIRADDTFQRLAKFGIHEEYSDKYWDFDLRQWATIESGDGPPESCVLHLPYDPDTLERLRDDLDRLLGQSPDKKAEAVMREAWEHERRRVDHQLGVSDG